MPADLARVTRAAQKAIEAQHRRDALIRDAHANGATLRAIAEAAGLSFSRIHQIVQGR